MKKSEVFIMLSNPFIPSSNGEFTSLSFQVIYCSFLILSVTYAGLENNLAKLTRKNNIFYQGVDFKFFL